MERTKALAVASAATIVLGSAIVAAAGVGGTSLLGFGGASTHGSPSFAASAENPAAKRRVIFRSRDVYDRYVVDTGAGDRVGLAPAGSATPTPSRTAMAGPDPTTPTSTPTTLPPAKPETPRPSPTTTVPPTPTTLPPGVPHDWPADKPIPPMPPNCRQPQLELNGVWNCQSND
jgi:hypothetical protein